MLLKKTVYTRIDTSENAPATQGELLRVWDRSWRLRGWKTRILLPGESVWEGSLVTPYQWINFSQKKFDLHFMVSDFGKMEWTSSPVVIFPEGVTEQQILECGRSLC